MSLSLNVCTLARYFLQEEDFTGKEFALAYFARHARPVKNDVFSFEAALMCLQEQNFTGRIVPMYLAHHAERSILLGGKTVGLVNRPNFAHFFT
jgi:hypothetical protein